MATNRTGLAGGGITLETLLNRQRGEAALGSSNFELTTDLKSTSSGDGWQHSQAGFCSSSLVEVEVGFEDERRLRSICFKSILVSYFDVFE